MEAKICAERSAELAKPNNGPKTLDLPAPTHVVSRAAAANKQLALEISWQSLPKLMSRPEFLRLRFEDRCFAEFDLYNPKRVNQNYPAELLDSIL